MKRKHIHSFDLFSRYDNYLPTYGGLVILLLLLLAGALLGSLAMALLTFINAGMANTYGMLVVYPLQFIPPMIYAAAHSYPDMFDDTETVKVDDNRFLEGGGNKCLKGFTIAVCVAVATLSCAVLTEPIISLLPEMPESLKAAMKLLTEGPLWVSLLSTAIFAPFFEEWLCRGMVLRGMLRKMSPMAAIAVSAAFFALIHMNPWQAIPAFILGCLFGLVYYKTGSLKLTMLMHAANNAFSVMLTRLPGAEDCDYIWQILPSKAVYGIIYAMCAVLLFIFTYCFVKNDFAKKN